MAAGLWVVTVPIIAGVKKVLARHLIDSAICALISNRGCGTVNYNGSYYAPFSVDQDTHPLRDQLGVSIIVTTTTTKNKSRFGGT